MSVFELDAQRFLQFDRFNGSYEMVVLIGQTVAPLKTVERRIRVKQTQELGEVALALL